MLTQEGYKKRFWADLITLRRILEDKKIPDKYYGLSTSDNMFESVGRTLRLSVLIRENRASIIDAASQDPQLTDALKTELKKLQSMLRSVSDLFEHECYVIEWVNKELKPKD